MSSDVSAPKLSMALMRAAGSGSNCRVRKRSRRIFCTVRAASVSPSMDALRGVRWSGEGSRAMEARAAARLAGLGSDSVNCTSAALMMPRTPALGFSTRMSDFAAVPASAPVRSRRLNPSAVAVSRKNARSALRMPSVLLPQASSTVAASGSPLAPSAAITGPMVWREAFSTRSAFAVTMSVTVSALAADHRHRAASRPSRNVRIGDLSGKGGVAGRPLRHGVSSSTSSARRSRCPCCTSRT